MLIVLGLSGYAVYDRVGARSASAAQVSSYENQPTLGEDSAPVKMILFENFLCEHCKAFEEEVFPQVKRDYIDTGKVEAYYVNLAWGTEDATTAALAGECAYRQNEPAFWEFKTAVYRAQGGEGERWATLDKLVSIAEGVDGLDAQALRSCVEEERYQDEVQRDLEIADLVGVQGTPSIIVGDQGFEGPGYSVLKRAIEQQLVN